MRKSNVLKDKSFAFALRIIQVYKELVKDRQENVLSKQLLRSGTAVGALIRESENAASRKDFLSKLNIALKEADETQYWLDLLFHSGFLTAELFTELSHACNEITSMLVASIKTLKSKLQVENR